jgi:hypothetical protein
MEAFAVTHTIEDGTYWDSIWETRDEANEHVLNCIDGLFEHGLEVGEFHVFEMVRKT